MSAPPSHRPAGAILRLSGPEATQAFGAAIAPALRAGDALLLDGPLGVGKTSLARAIIEARLAAEGRHEEVPSPSFTLVQIYETAALTLWHCDLYRLSGPSEVAELGLDEAFETAACLIEWPDRLGRFRPARHLTLRLSEDGTGRVVEMAPVGDWARLLHAAGCA